MNRDRKKVAMDEPVIEVRNINKSFRVQRPLMSWILSGFSRQKRIQALENVSFTVTGAQILAVAGPNGAGKTTLLRILADLLEPEGGSVRLCGQNMNGDMTQIRRRIGYISSDERSFFWRLSGRQNLEFFASLYRMSRNRTEKKIDEMLELFGLKRKSEQLFRDYSAGTRKKFAIIRGLLHEPQILLLDEVTNSLDRDSASLVKHLIRSYISKNQNRAAVWSTHRMEEIREMCDRLLTIERGRVSKCCRANEIESMPSGYKQQTGNKDKADNCMAQVSGEKKYA
jgi:ABC-2 type transport system ATP-binding protein